MNKNQEEKQYLLEQNKSKYKNDNGIIMGFPSLSPAETLTQNMSTFTMFRLHLRIEKKMMDILIKIRVCDKDDNVEDIDIFFKSDEKEEKDEEDSDEEENDEEKEDYEEDEESEEEEDEMEQNNKENDEACDKNKDKIMKEEDKKIFKEMKNLFKEYVLITRSAFKDFSYYYTVIENLYKGYKKNYLKNGIGKLYDGITTKIISIVNNNFSVYDQKLINIVDKINDINSNLNDI